jgi:hypothetical protein
MESQFHCLDPTLVDRHDPGRLTTCFVIEHDPLFNLLAKVVTLTLFRGLNTCKSFIEAIDLTSPISTLYVTLWDKYLA